MHNIMAQYEFELRRSTPHTVLPLFSTPVYYRILEPIDAHLVKYVKESLYEPFTSGTGYVTKNKQLLDEPLMQELKSIIEEEVHYYTNKILGINNKLKYKMISSWANLHSRNDYIPEHSHYNSLLSGVVYIRTNEETGDFILKNKSNMFPQLISPKLDECNIFNSDYWNITPKDNMIILFPSNLTHSTQKNRSTMDRYSIAFDYFPYGELDNSYFGNLSIQEPTHS